MISLFKKVCKNACKFFLRSRFNCTFRWVLRPTVSGAVQILSDLEVRAQISRRKQLATLNFRSILRFPGIKQANLGVRRPAGVGGAADLRVPARSRLPPSRNRPLLVDRTTDSAFHSPSTGHAAGHPPQGSEGHYLLTPARRMHGRSVFEGKRADLGTLSFSRLLCFLRSHHWLPASDTGRTAGPHGRNRDWTKSPPIGRRPARDWPRGRRGFESQPRSGKFLPKCHVGPGCGVRPARRADSGSRRGAGRWGGWAARGKPVRGVRCRPPRGGAGGSCGRLWSGVAVEPGRRRDPLEGRLWLRAEGPGESPGQRLRRAGGGEGRCPQKSRPRCWRKTWWRSLR